MVWIRMLSTLPGKDIDLPASVRHRSCEGNTLILTPGTTREITDEEWKFIQNTQPDVAAGIVVLVGNAKPTVAAPSGNA